MAQTNENPEGHWNRESAWREVKDWWTSSISEQVSLVEAALAKDTKALRTFDSAYKPLVGSIVAKCLLNAGRYTEDAHKELTTVSMERLFYHMRYLKHIKNWCVTPRTAPLRRWLDDPRADDPSADDPRAPVTALIVTVIRNFMSDELYKIQIVVPPQHWEYDDTLIELWGNPRVGQARRVEELLEAVGRLDECYKKVVTLRLEGYSQVEIAQKVGRKEPTVSRWLKEAKTRLRKLLSDNGTV